MEVPALPRRGPAGAGRVERPRRERGRPAHRARRRPARINEVDQLAAMEAAACVTSSGVRGLLTGLEPGMTEREAVAPPRLGRLAAECHLMLTAGRAGPARAAQPGRPADRARRPVHRGVRDLGRAELPGRVRRGGRLGAAGRRSPTTSTGSSGRTSRRSSTGTRRSTSARPAARSRRSSTGTWATRSSGSS